MATETVRAATVACTSDDMNQRTEHEQHAANLRAAWESTDPEWLHDAVMSAAAHLDELTRIEENEVKVKMTTETRPCAVTVVCTAADMTVGQTTEPEERARVLEEAWESADPEWLYSAILGVVAYLNALGHEERERIKRPVPGQEIKFSDLEALPYGSLVSDSAGDYWEKHPSGEWNCYQFLDTASISEDYGPFTFESL